MSTGTGRLAEPPRRGNFRCTLVQRGVVLTVDVNIDEDECAWLQGVYMPDGTEITELFTGTQKKGVAFDGDAACIAIEEYAVGEFEAGNAEEADHVAIAGVLSMREAAEALS